MGTDSLGLGLSPEFWSGSDAAIRLRALPAHDLAQRELTLLASRRSLGLNAPRPWAAWTEIEAMARAWEPEAEDVHFSQVPMDEEPASLWSHYGMGQSFAEPVVFGWGMRESTRPPLGRVGSPWAGGPGSWYAWSTLLDWDLWPRRQDVEPRRAAPEPGRLLLFVSHRWETLEHPDPTGAQLVSLKVGLLMALAAAVLRDGGSEERTGSGLPELMSDYLATTLSADDWAGLRPWAEEVRQAAEEAGDEETFRAAIADRADWQEEALLSRIRERILVWYDYASMYQEPRTPEQEEAFRREILQLNHIQASAGTVVIAGDEQYLSRAWCFLELCGGMRHRITELTPTWGSSVGVGDSVTRWASRSDQLIGALRVLGPEAISGSGLRATHPDDLPAIAGLLSMLPLTALVETDDSDLVGGTLPIPFRSGEWLLPEGSRGVSPSRERALTPTPTYGQIPDGGALRSAAERNAEANGVASPVGVWVYTTQRALSLAWAARAPELWRELRRELAAADPDPELAEALAFTGSPAVSCMWADARSLAEDGHGWTRTIPSSVRALVVLTQTDLPELCWIYDWVVRAHRAAGIPVITHAPDTGRTLLYLEEQEEGEGEGEGGEEGEARAVGRRLDVLAVPRLRRPDIRANRLFLPSGSDPRDVEVLAALRLDPREGRVPPGRIAEEAAAGGVGDVGEEVTPEWLLGFSEERARAEGLARSTAASWDDWCAPRLGQGSWQVGMAPLQLRIVEQLVRKSWAVSDNPFRRRKLLKILVEDHEGYALPPSILDDADAIIAMILEKERGPDEA